MYQKAPMTDRVKRIRERYRNTIPNIDINRYRLVTEFYMENPQLTGILKRAKNLRNLFENMPTPVFEDDLIVGFPGTTYRCCALYPEFSFNFLMKDILNGTVMNRDVDPYTIRDEDLEYIAKTGDFWQKNCHSAIVTAYRPEIVETLANNGVISFGARPSSGGPVGHFCGNHYKAVDVGFAAVAAEARAKMEQMEEDGIFGRTIYQYNFYRAVDIVCTGIIHYTERYAKECERQAAECKDEARKAELYEMADCLNWIMKNPARNFHDAVQIVYMYQLGFILDAQLHGTSLGRIDQYTGKYYEKDLAEGKITPERGQELIDCFALKLAENNKVMFGTSSSAPGYTSGQLITIGGVDKDGNDASNPVTYFMLQANSRMFLHDPPIALRIHDGTPDDLWEAAIEASKMAGGVPSYEYDGVIVPALMERGLSLEDARNYALMGCVEPCGCGTEWAEPGGSGGESYINIAVLLLIAINNGVNPQKLPGGAEPKRTGLPTGYLYEMNSIEEVMDAVDKQMNFFCKWQASNVNSWEYCAAWHYPLPLMSAMQEGCMESGKDVMWGGSKYNSTGNSCVGVGNLGDSLNIINHICFETKKATTRELYDALMNNWEGYEELRQYIVGKAPHYGNADPEVDKFMKFAADCYADNINRCSGPRGNHFHAGCYPVTLNVLYGYMTPATPDGRKAGEPLTDGISPLQGQDKGGPLTTINSLLCFDQLKYSNGTLCNMKFHPTALNREDGWKKLRDVMATYFSGGGMELQLNIVSADTLRDAQDHPENYKDLVVRVAGFSAYFVEVFKDSQDDLIRRTEMNV
ncbi:MAG: hypothetical protein IJH99_08730 [Eubacterium sp.]|nr:hypothetical protein [Eubacterium sp.]